MTVSLNNLHRTNFNDLNLELAVASNDLNSQAAKTDKVAGLRIKLVIAKWKIPGVDSSCEKKIQYFDFKTIGNIHQMLTEFHKVQKSASSFVQGAKTYGIYIFAKILGNNKVLSQRGFEIINAENMDSAKLRDILKEGSETAEPNF